jgi:hypothetical protein
MPDFQLNSVSGAAPASHIHQVEAPKPPAPPKSQSDHKALNPPTSSRGPAVVLSGALAKPVEKHGAQAHADAGPATGQHVNHVI